MPRPKRQTLADRVLAMLETGAKPREVAEALETSETYVHVCRARARERAAGLMRTRKKRRKPIETPEQRQERLRAIAAKAHATRAKRRALANLRRSWGAQSWLIAEQNRLRELDLLRTSSIAYRRAHVQRVLEAWKGNP